MGAKNVAYMTEKSKFCHISLIFGVKHGVLQVFGISDRGYAN